MFHACGPQMHCNWQMRIAKIVIAIGRLYSLGIWQILFENFFLCFSFWIIFLLLFCSLDQILGRLIHCWCQYFWLCDDEYHSSILHFDKTAIEICWILPSFCVADNFILFIASVPQIFILPSFQRPTTEHFLWMRTKCRIHTSKAKRVKRYALT